MVDLRWLDELPPPIRWTAVGTALGAAVAGTVVPAQGTAALGVVGAVAGGLAGLWWFGVASRRSPHSVDPLSERDRGILARRAMQMVEDDPGFSLPRLVEELRAELLPTRLGGPVEIGPVERLPPSTADLDTLELVVPYQTAARSGVAVLALERRGEHWSIRELRDVPELPRPAVHPSPWVIGNRRALLARSEAFDLEAFEAHVRQIDDVLERAESDAELRPYTTPIGLSSIRWWRDHGGLPARGEALTWVDVVEDAWYERVDLQLGDRVLGLLRPTASPHEPWRLWRLRGAS